MRVVHTEAALSNAVIMTRNEAQVAFGNPVVYAEKYLENPRHIEFQLLIDEQGNAVHLGERDCSMQRRHQKFSRKPRPRAFRKHCGIKLVSVVRKLAVESNIGAWVHLNFFLKTMNFIL